MYFNFKEPASAQVLASACKILCQLDVLIWTVRRFLHAKHFQSGMLAKKPRGHISMDVLLSVGSGMLVLDFTHANAFQSVLHARMPKLGQMQVL